MSYRVVICLILVFCCSPIFGQGQYDVMIKAGDQALDNNGQFGAAGNIFVNNLGQATFGALYANTAQGSNDDGVIFFYDPSQLIGQRLMHVAREGNSLPEGDGDFGTSTGWLSFQDDGNVYFGNFLDNTSNGSTYGLYQYDAVGGLAKSVRNGDTVPGSGEVITIPSNSHAFSISGPSDLFFGATINDGTTNRSAILRKIGNGPITKIAVRDQAVPNGDGNFLVLSTPFSGSNDGRVYFTSTLYGQSNSQANVANYVFENGQATELFRRGDALPGTSKVFYVTQKLESAYADGHLMTAQIANTTSGGGIQVGSYLIGNMGTVTELVRWGMSTPDGNDTFSNYSHEQYNGNGQFLFLGRTQSNTATANYYMIENGVMSEFLADGASAQFGDYTFDFGIVGGGSGAKDLANLNDHGVVGLFARLNGGNTSFFTDGIFLTDGTEIVHVAHETDYMNDRPVGQIYYGGDFNNYGQLGYRITYSDGSPEEAVLYTPDLHWRGGTSGSWLDKQNWTVGLPPAFVHEVFIDPDENTVVTGPSTNVGVDSLFVGGGLGDVNMQLDPAGVLAAERVIVESNGMITGNGSIESNVVFRGKFAPGSSAGEITIDGGLVFDVTGQLEIELGGTDLADFDRVIVDGAAAFGGTLSVDLINNFTLNHGDSFEIIDVSGTHNGFFQGLSEGAMVSEFGNQALFITYSGGDGNDVTLYAQAIPEPSSMLFLALLTVHFLRRRKRG